MPTLQSFAVAWIAWSTCSVVTVAGDSSAIVPDRVINLIADPEFEDFDVFQSPDSESRKAPVSSNRELWTLKENGQLHVRGKAFGVLQTKKRYRDYHCVLDYKWGERTWGFRDGKARSSGFIFHGRRPEIGRGSLSRSFEVQLIEGGTGNVLVRSGSTADTRLELVAEVRSGRGGEHSWTPGGSRQTFPALDKKDSRINWRYKSPDWVDVRGFRGSKDIENPVGEWNRLEVICRGDTVQVFLNGIQVNAASEMKPSEGHVGLLSDFAECIVRRWELHPLDTLTEKWTPEKRSADMGYSVTGESIMPRRLPLSPEESRKLWQIDSDKYELQLAAAEPVTCDPVDIVWDEHGRMFVAEMGDYPTPASHPGFLSRIRLLKDTDRDGRMDRAVTWASELDHVQGLLPMNGGLLATTRTAILFLKDTDGDDRADIREVLFNSNEPRHSQLQVASPRWGPDNAIYINNGIDGKEIYPHENPDNVIPFTRQNLRYDPYSKTMRPATGLGQFGASFDDFGRHFFCSNRNPVMFAVMPQFAVKRNPRAGITSGHEDIQPPASPVWPLALSHTTSVAHAGTHTSACGLCVYRADLMPELSGNIFVCDPTSQLVTRNRLVAEGASFKAERVGEKKDFLVSGDEWCRPVQVRNGPDGALYIVDMYRRFIDHAQYFPEDFQKTHYMRAGLDHGRIWRLVPKDSSAIGDSSPLPSVVPDLVAELESDIGWRRVHTQRLLVEKADAAAVTPLENLLEESESPEAVAHAMWTLHGLKAIKPSHVLSLLGHENPSVVENAIRLAADLESDDDAISDKLAALIGHGNDRVRFMAAVHAPKGSEIETGPDFLAKNPSDIWIRRAFASSFGDQAGATLSSLLSDASFVADPGLGRSYTLQELARLTAANADLTGMTASLSALEGESAWHHFAVLNGFNAGLRGGSLDAKTLGDLIAEPPEQMSGHTDRLESILEDAISLALNRERSEADRIAALPLVAQQGFKSAVPVVEKLIVPSESADVQLAACRALGRFSREKVADFFFERWDQLPPIPLREALNLITANPKTGLILMKKMKAGEIPSGLMPAMTRWVYGRSGDKEIRSLAEELFGNASGDRAKIVAEYRVEIGKHEGDPTLGRAVFSRACIACHRSGDIGTDVGPALMDVKMKPPEALLTDILDPNRAVEERWVSWTVATTDGRTLTGLVQSDEVGGIELKLSGGLVEAIPRSEIKKISATGFSLMPVGLEAAISPSDMAHLIAFLKQR